MFMSSGSADSWTGASREERRVAMTADTEQVSAFGWMARYVLIPALLAMLVLLGVGGYFAYKDHRVRSFTGDITPFLAQFGIVLPDPAASVPRVSVNVPPQPEPMREIISVNSYPPDALYPLESWQVVNDPAGFIDWIRVDGELQPVDQPVRLHPGQVIEIGGWAGHRLLGMQFAEVLISTCEIVIAGAPVELERADIASSIHPNLGNSGWRATLFAGDIPACPGVQIRAWGRPPVGTTLRPIVGGRKIAFIEPTAARTATRQVAHVTPAVLPEQAPRPTSIRLERLVPEVVFHRCASTQCSVLSRTESEIFEAVVVERGDGWLLLQSATGSGWVQANDVVPAP